MKGRFAGRLRSTLGVRVAGAALCTAGLAFIGFGTVGTHLEQGSMALTSAPSCAAGTECLHATQAPTTGDNSGCSDIADLLGQPLDSTDSYWHFVIPDSQGFLFNGTNFTATFSGGSVESVTFVQAMSGGFKGVVVVADGGVTLENAVVTESGITGETTEAEGTGAENTASGGDFQLSASCVTPATTSTTSGTTQTVTAPGTTVTTTVSGTTTLTNSHTTTETVTTTVPTTVTVTTISGTTVTETTSVPATTTTTVTTPGTTSTSTVTTTLTVPTTVTVTSGTPGTSTSSSSTSSTSSGTPGSSTSSSSASSASPGSSHSSTPTSSAGVLGVSTGTPGTGADVEFGLGLALLVSGGGVLAVASRIARRKND